MNTVQVNFVNNAARPHMEEIVKAIHVLDTFVADYDALQNSADAIPEDATVLDDNSTGTAPRSDAPQLTGAQVKTLRDLSANMSAQVIAATKETLISKMVRPLAQVLKV
jgi:hypothetical protein